MDLSKLRPAAGSTKSRKRIGRGQGSGRGGTSTRGHKGQKSRSGGQIPAGFEGGQMPLQRRVPKYGFKNPFRTEFAAVNVARLSELLEAGRIESGATVSPATLHGLGIVGKRDRVKILGDGELGQALTIEAHAFSKSAREKIEAAGGTVHIVE